MAGGEATVGNGSARAERRFGEESAVCCRHMLFPSFFALRPPAPPLSLDESILIGRDGDGGLSRYVRGKAEKVMLVRLLEIKLS